MLLVKLFDISQGPDFGRARAARGTGAVIGLLGGDLTRQTVSWIRIEAWVELVRRELPSGQLGKRDYALGGQPFFRDPLVDGDPRNLEVLGHANCAASLINCSLDQMGHVVPRQSKLSVTEHSSTVTLNMQMLGFAL